MIFIENRLRTVVPSVLAAAYVTAFALLSTASAFAQDAAAPASPQQAPGAFAMLVPFVAMFGVMYFLMIRPQQKKMREQQNLLSSIQSGDEVVTTSGILGKVKTVEDKVVTIEIDRDVQVRMLKSQIAQKTSAVKAELA